LRLLVSPDARDGSVKIHQDVSLYVARLEPGQGVAHALGPRRHAWVQVAKGEVTVNGQNLVAGDAAALSEESNVNITSKTDGEVLVFDLK
jgi:redox-sensitive bicupin YhaK (pirin superfamily)